MPERDTSLDDLSRMLGRIFAPSPNPKEPPLRLFRVEWKKPQSVGYAKYTLSYKRFSDEADADAFAAEHDSRVEKWVGGLWLSKPTSADEERKARMMAARRF